MKDAYDKATDLKLPVICLYSDPYYRTHNTDDVPDMVTSVEGILSFKKTGNHKTGTESSIQRPTYIGLKTNSNNEEFDGAWTLVQPEQLNDQLRRFPNGKRFIELTDDVSGQNFYVQIDNIKRCYPYIPDHKMSVIRYHHSDQAGPVRIRESVDAIYDKIQQELADFPTTSTANTSTESALPPEEENDFRTCGRQRGLSPDFGGASDTSWYERERRRREAEEERRQRAIEEREEQMALHNRTLAEQLEVERLSRQAQEQEQEQRRSRSRGLSR